MDASLRESERTLRTRCLAGFLFKACLLAYVLLGWLQAGHSSVLVLGAGAALDLAAYSAVRYGPRVLVAPVARLAPVWGVATWAVLTGLEGGVGRSFFAVGFGFEILISAVGASVAGVLRVTAGSVLALCAQQALVGLEGFWGPLVGQASALAIVGGVAARVRRGWDRRVEAERERLRAVEQELADAQALADLGARNARLGHGLKNAVHSLRGFSSLIERDAAESPALRGLRGSIDQLEDLAHASLRPRANGRSTAAEHGELREILDAVVAETTAAHPDVRFRVLWEDEETVRVPRALLSEVLSNLLRNSAESMDRRGEVTVHVERVDGRFGIRVSDQGPGIPAGLEGQVFRPGYTSKREGHGMGLFLARSLMEAQGGSLSLEPSATGATFRVGLPEAWGG